MVKIEKIEIYRVGDKTFNSWVAARQYETELKIAEINANVEKTISSYRISSKYFKRYLPFPILLIKGDDEYYLIDSEEKAFSIALEIITRNNDSEYSIYFEEREAIAQAIIDAKDGAAALGFLFDNVDNEDEELRIVKFS